MEKITKGIDGLPQDEIETRISPEGGEVNLEALIGSSNTFAELYANIKEAQKSDPDFCPPSMFDAIAAIEKVAYPELAEAESIFRTYTRKYGLRDMVKKLVINFPEKTRPQPVESSKQEEESSAESLDKQKHMIHGEIARLKRDKAQFEATLEAFGDSTGADNKKLEDYEKKIAALEAQL